MSETETCFIDKVAHLNHTGNECLANAMFHVLMDNHLFVGKQNGKIVSPFFVSDAQTFDSEGLTDFKNQLIHNRIADYKNKKIGSIVMNCNPFTNGHYYLIEQSRKQVDELYIFVVEENKSYFSFEDRLKLVQENCAAMDNVTVLPSGRFIISTETFPEYFAKNELQSVTIDASRDVEIFGREIAPVLNIRYRFVGTEPMDQVTAQYNEALKSRLSSYGVQIIELERISIGENVVSASYVRKELEAGNLLKVQEYVPPATFIYLNERFKNKN